MTSQKRAYLFALAAVLMWSTVATAFKLALDYYDPLQLLLTASGISIIVLAVAVWQQGALSRLPLLLSRRPAHYLLLGLINPLCYYITLFGAYDRLPAQQAQSLNYTWAITLSLLAVPFLGQKLRWRDGLACLLGYSGAVIIATRGDLLALQFESTVGVALALFSTLLWSGYWILNTRNQDDPLSSLLLAFLVGWPFTLLATVLFSDLDLWRWQGLMGATYVGLFEMGLAFLCWMMAMKQAQNTSKISNLIFISPFLSLFFINTFLHEPIHPATYLGLGLIVCGLLSQQLRGPRRASPVSE